jgi:hypothetical protein
MIWATAKMTRALEGQGLENTSASRALIISSTSEFIKRKDKERNNPLWVEGNWSKENWRWQREEIGEEEIGGCYELMWKYYRMAIECQRFQN